MTMAGPTHDAMSGDPALPQHRSGARTSAYLRKTGRVVGFTLVLLAGLLTPPTAARTQTASPAPEPDSRSEFTAEDIARILDRKRAGEQNGTAALSLPEDEAEEGSRMGRWRCYPLGALTDFTTKAGSVTLNNFQLREGTEFGERVPQAQLSVSAVNRGSESAFFTLQFIGLTANKIPVVAMSARPGFGLVSPLSNGEMRASAYVTAGEVRSIETFCLRVDGRF